MLALQSVLWLAEALVLALRRVSSLIVSLSQSGRALLRPEVAYLDQLVEGLRRCPNNGQGHSNTLKTYYALSPIFSMPFCCTPLRFASHVKLPVA